MVDTDVFGDFSRAVRLGTDYLGVYMLSGIIFGTRYTIGIALARDRCSPRHRRRHARACWPRSPPGWIDAALSRLLSMR